MHVTTNVHTYICAWSRHQTRPVIGSTWLKNSSVHTNVQICMYVFTIYRKSYGHTYLAHALMILKNRFCLYVCTYVLVYKYTVAKVQMCGHMYFCVLQYVCKYIFTLICMNIFVIGKFIWGLLDIIYK